MSRPGVQKCSAGLRVAPAHQAEGLSEDPDRARSCTPGRARLVARSAGGQQTMVRGPAQGLEAFLSTGPVQLGRPMFTRLPEQHGPAKRDEGLTTWSVQREKSLACQLNHRPSGKQGADESPETDEQSSIQERSES